MVIVFRKILSTQNHQSETITDQSIDRIPTILTGGSLVAKPKKDTKENLLGFRASEIYGFRKPSGNL